MTKKLIFALFASAAVGFVACEQNIGSGENPQTTVAKPDATELARTYNYQKVKVVKGFEVSSKMLETETPNSVPLTFSSTPPHKVGDEINIIGVTDAKAKLGRVLFYDKQMSINNAIACASCHHQDKAFSDGQQFSEGFKGAITTRNSLSITSPGMIRSGMFWDRRESTVRDMSLNPVQNHIEMGMEDLALLEKKMGSLDYYPQLFKDAYPAKPYVSKENISDALTAFMRSMITWNAKYDQGETNNFANFTAEEKRGMDIFTGGGKVDQLGLPVGACVSCHAAPMFNDGLRANAYYDIDFLSNSRGGLDIGLDMVAKDKGVAGSGGGFKIPSLRNVELTAPYMHDGRFKTLEEVVDHYNDGIKPTPNLSNRLKDDKGKPKKLNLTDADKKAVIAFLKTLTDKSYVTDPKYSNPFKN